MQKIFIFIFFIFSKDIVSQTIPVTHMPRVGDTFIFAVDNSIYTPKPQTGGLYDFSDLTQDDTTVFYYKSVGSSSPVPNANLKLVIDTAESAATYFKTTSNAMYVLSLGEIMSSIPFPGVTNLKGSLNNLSLPMTATTTASSSDSIQFSIPASAIPADINVDSLVKALIPGIPSGATVAIDSILVSVRLNLNLSVKGSGKIKTPMDNNLDVLLLERRISFSPRMIVMGKATFLSINIPITYDVTTLVADQIPIGGEDQIQHSYYSPSFRQEIVSAVVDSMGLYQTVNWRFRTKNGNATVNLSNISMNDYNIIFQPTQFKIDNLSFNKETICNIYDMNGKLLYRNSMSALKSSFPWTIPSGNIIVQLIEDGILRHHQIYKINR